MGSGVLKQGRGSMERAGRSSDLRGSFSHRVTAVGNPSAGFEEGRDERFRVEIDEVIGLLPQTDHLQGEA